MKKILYTIPALLLFGACNYLDIVPDDTATLEHAFADATTSERYLLTCYTGLPEEASPYANPAFLGSDEYWFPRKDSRWGLFGDYLPPASLLFDLQNTDSPQMNYYEGYNNGKALYTTIRKCNIFINRIGDVPNVSVITKNRWIAEAKMIKAYCFYYLVRMYGPIPIVDYEVDVDAPPEQVRFERNTFDECIAHITGLLDELTPSLPLIISLRSEELGRFTQPAACMLKAKTLILAASPLFNGNSYFHDFTNNDGKALFGAQDDNKWVLARDACKTAIESCEEAGITLYTYDDGGTLNEAGLMEHTIRNCITSDDWSSELIMGGGVNVAEQLQREAMPRFSKDTYIGALPTTMSVALSFVDKFYTDKGIPADEDPDWASKDLYALREPEGGELDYITETNPEFNFDREPRFYASIGFSRGTWYGNGQIGDSPWSLYSYAGEVAAPQGDAVYMTTTGIFPKKLCNMKNETVTAGTSVQIYPFPVMRLADLYLLYAECVNEVEGPTAEAKKYIDLVRRRAGLDGVDDSWAKSSNPAKPNSKQGFRAIVHRERTIELAFEGHRFWDVRRWMEFDSEVNQPITGWYIRGTNAEEYFQRVVHYKPALYMKDYLWPMRLTLLTINPNLSQTKGWQ